MTAEHDSWRLTYGVLASLALVGLAFSDVYRPPQQTAAAQAAPKHQMVYLDQHETSYALHKYIVPLHSLDDRSAPLNSDTPFIATKENPFSGKTTDAATESWALASPNTGANTARSDQAQGREQDNKKTSEDALFPVDRQNVGRASPQMIVETGEALRPFQELPQKLRPDSELLINFDSRGRISLGAAAEKNAEYFYRMVARISEQWNIYFPKFQHYFGFLDQGEVLLTFALDLDGKVGEIRLVQPHNQSSINESCILAIRAAHDFGPIPAEYRDQGGMVIPFAFIYHRPERPLKMFH